jgi:hypothetical protein
MAGPENLIYYLYEKTAWMGCKKQYRALHFMMP